MKINKTNRDRIIIVIAFVSLGVAAFSDEISVIGLPGMNKSADNVLAWLIFFICIFFLEINKRRLR